MTAAALHEKDPAKRIALYEQIQTMHREKSPFIFMFQKLNTYASTKGVTGMHITVLNDNPYELVKKA